MSAFDFEPVYIPGVENVLSDTLSRIYSNDVPGTTQASSEYAYTDVDLEDRVEIASVMPILVGLEGEMVALHHDSQIATHAVTRSSPKADEPVVEANRITNRRSNRLAAKDRTVWLDKGTGVSQGEMLGLDAKAKRALRTQGRVPSAVAPKSKPRGKQNAMPVRKT
ncbi:hypothetical protein HGRIS_009055 [Hohenbuehelia grisea]|uniref:Uncharacterized protein n=1 Tax=Hohenbuehelia grisea TaxID=104357 RepID=A0ABR3IZZ2_9AGAR